MDLFTLRTIKIVDSFQSIKARRQKRSPVDTPSQTQGDPEKSAFKDNCEADIGATSCLKCDSLGSIGCDDRPKSRR